MMWMKSLLNCHSQIDKGKPSFAYFSNTLSPGGIWFLQSTETAISLEIIHQRNIIVTHCWYLHDNKNKRKNVLFDTKEKEDKLLKYFLLDFKMRFFKKM